MFSDFQCIIVSPLPKNHIWKKSKQIRDAVENVSNISQ